MNSIAFTADMARAILDGRKTQTRSVDKIGETGDILLVKEPYVYDGGVIYAAYEGDKYFNWIAAEKMPRAFSRFSIRITSVRQERLQDISEEDAIKEGIEPLFAKWTKYTVFRNYRGGLEFLNPIWSFRSLWDSINDKPGRAWADNPLVWVHEFEVVTGEES